MIPRDLNRLKATVNPLTVNKLRIPVLTCRNAMALSKFLKKFASSEFEFVEQTSKDFDCPVCFQVIWNPFLTECCGNHFCETCVEITKEKNNQCPICNEKPISGIIDKKFQRQINELKIYCLHKKHGCLWVGELGKLIDHLEEDKIDGECNFVRLSCSLSCGEQIIRCNLKKHLTEECTLRACTCEYCGYSSTYKNVTSTHYSNCPDYPVVCPNLCTEKKLKRSSLDRHLLDCPDEVVSCSFNEMGCEEKIKRQCLQQHIEANVMQHQLMICTAFKNVRKENEALKDDIKMLKQTNKELQKKNVSLKNAQNMRDYSIIGFVLKVDEAIATHQWKDYFPSLATISTDTPNPVTPVIIKWPDYSEVKQLVKSRVRFGDSTSYFTRPFYTHCNGYKMQLKVYPCNENKSISVFCYLMKGENDDHLTWPYKGTITISLLNQLQDSGHFTETIHLGNFVRQADAVKKPEPDQIRNTGWGYSEFISLSAVESSTALKQYLMNDTLYFKISTTVVT